MTAGFMTARMTTAGKTAAGKRIARTLTAQTLAMLIVGACCISSTALTGSQALAQYAADPFGGGDDDPFGGTPKAKPPVKPVNDPFDADPFAGGKVSEKAKAKAREAYRKAMQAAAHARNKAVKAIPAPSKAMDDAEARIQSALSDETTHSFIQTPLSDAIQQISDTHNIPIVVDRRALEEIGLDHEVGVTIDLKNVTLRSFLRLMLRDLDLTYLIKDEVMQITTAEAAEDNLVTEMYVLAPKFAAKAEPLVKILQGTVVPDTWDVLGGNSTMYPFDHVLIVSTTSDVHDQVQQFLAELVETYGE